MKSQTGARICWEVHKFSFLLCGHFMYESESVLHSHVAPLCFLLGPRFKSPLSSPCLQLWRLLFFLTLQGEACQAGGHRLPSLLWRDSEKKYVRPVVISSDTVVHFSYSHSGTYLYIFVFLLSSFSLVRENSFDQCSVISVWFTKISMYILHAKIPDNHTFPCRGPCGVTHSSEPVKLRSLAGWGWETNALFSHKPLNLLSIEGSHGNTMGMQRRFWEDPWVRLVYSPLYKCILLPRKCSTREFILKLWKRGVFCRLMTSDSPYVLIPFYCL